MMGQANFGISFVDGKGKVKYYEGKNTHFIISEQFFIMDVGKDKVYIPIARIVEVVFYDAAI